MPHPVDIHVGKRIRTRRWTVDETQKYLAEKVGVKCQQIQNYEMASNRVSASRLWDISKVLGVDVTYFFEGFDPKQETSVTHEFHRTASQEKEAIALVQSYYKIPKHQRPIFLQLAKSLTDNTPAD